MILIILDSVGIGAAADAAFFGDEGANTLQHIYQMTGLRLPHLEALGLDHLLKLDSENNKSQGLFAHLSPESHGKDTVAGHWEMMGIILNTPLPVYPQGFPNDIIFAFTKAIGRGVLGNMPASGTKIIKQLGQAHIQSGKPIVYTSSDSVFQIAAHEDIIPVHELYRYCEIARAILQGPHGVGRVIARPFIGDYPNFKRTDRRKDYALEPTGETVLDRLVHYGIPVHAIGKISDIFANRGISSSVHTSSNRDGCKHIIQALHEQAEGLIFSNLVDFDMLYGHRRDVVGYAQALKDFDKFLPKLLSQLKPSDCLMITADHGNDPTFKGSDHTREDVPLLVYAPALGAGDLGKETFSSIGATILTNFGLRPLIGKPLFKI